MSYFRRNCGFGDTFRKFNEKPVANVTARAFAATGKAAVSVRLANDEAQMAKLDDTDRQLLMLLQEDDRQPLAVLSEKIGAAVSTINDRIKRLVRSGTISGFHARVAPETVGLDLLAFIMVSWTNPKIEAGFLERVKASPDVLECHHITGAWNYLLKVRVGTTRDLERFLNETVKAVDGVERTETLITLSTTKEIWSVSL